VPDAEAYLEPVDVAKNEYVCYDSEGRRLTVRPDSREKTKGFATSNRFGVLMETAEETPRHELQLRARLEAYMRAFDVETDHSIETESLSALIDRARRCGSHRNY
ncbi:MAG: hypothetical protein ACRDSJ_01050, partial [Rubrobacteraceae bacterium]